MNYIDLLLVLIVLVSVAGGWRRGFILGMFDLVRWIGGLLAALFLYGYTARLLASVFDGTSVWGPPIAFLLTFFAASGAIGLLQRMLLRRLPVDLHRTKFNRALGIVPGLVSGTINAAIIAAVLLSLPLSEGMHRTAEQSTLAGGLASYTDRLEEMLSPVFDRAIGRTLNRLTVKPESSESVKLPFTVRHPRPRPDLEARMLVLLNEERAAAGLKPLAADTALRAVARRYSAEMFARGYFSHISPEGLSPFDRIEAARIRFRTAGENLALAPTLAIAHQGLMNSPGHRANILRPQFGRVGIGIMDGGVHGLMVTQNFRN